MIGRPQQGLPTMDGGAHGLMSSNTSVRYVHPSATLIRKAACRVVSCQHCIGIGSAMIVSA